MKKAHYTVPALLVAMLLSLSFGVMASAQTNNEEVDGSLKTRSFESLQSSEDDERETQAIQRVMREKNEERATPTMEDSRRAVIVEKQAQADAMPTSGISTRKATSNIRDIAESIEAINQVNSETRDQLREEVEARVLEEVNAQARDDVSAEAFKNIQNEVVETVRQIQNDIDARVQSIGSGGEPTRADLQKRVDVALEELEASINTKNNTSIELTESKNAAQKRVEQLEIGVDEFKKKLEKEDGFSLYRDSDNDGLSDYDEVNIYGTDPLHAFTSGSELTDGERVLQGLNPLDDAHQVIEREDPRERGPVVRDLFKVRDIRVNEVIERTRPIQRENDEGELVDTNEIETVADAGEIVFSGSALPNTIVTLYIFSTPIVVTVKADSAGEWTYTLDQELEDGDHEVFVASVDTTGRILARSQAIPFVKTAAAVEFVAPDTLGAATPLSEGFLTRNFLLIASIVLVLVILAALAFIGMRSDDDGTNVPPASPLPPQSPPTPTPPASSTPPAETPAL